MIGMKFCLFECPKCGKTILIENIDGSYKTVEELYGKTGYKYPAIRETICPDCRDITLVNLHNFHVIVAGEMLNSGLDGVF
jgi:acetone carboxylase gamma subunit